MIDILTMNPEHIFALAGAAVGAVMLLIGLLAAIRVAWVARGLGDERLARYIRRIAIWLMLSIMSMAYANYLVHGAVAAVWATMAGVGGVAIAWWAFLPRTFGPEEVSRPVSNPA